MSNFDFDQVEVVELKKNEIKEVDGGLPIAPLVAGGLLLVFVAAVAEGILEVYNEKHP